MLEITNKKTRGSEFSSVSESRIFAMLTDFLQNSFKDENQRVNKGIISIPPAKMDKGGSILFTNLKKGGFATLVVSGRPRWNPRAKYYEAARVAARKGRNITRLFLLMNSQYMREKVVREHWLLDSKAGIKVEFAYVGNWLLENPLPKGTLDFGIWDNDIVCFAYTNPYVGESCPREWVASRRPEDIDLAIRTRDSLLRHRTTDNPQTILKRINLEEPMLKSAPLMKMLSEVLCRGSYLDQEGCAWYHGSWQYLRILDLVSTPTWHSDFYKRALNPDSSVSSNTTPRILVSGAADYSMTAHIIWAYENVNAKCHITVLDLCQTPLWLNKWYATGKDFDTDIICSDILQYSPSIKFDYVVTDAFLTRFENGVKVAVLDKWNDSLTARGKIVTTVRIDDAPSPVKATPHEASIFSEKVGELANRWQEFISVSPEELSSVGKVYAEKMLSYPFRNLEEVKKLFVQCGFTLTDIEENLVKGEMKSTRYAEIVARKKY